MLGLIEDNARQGAASEEFDKAYKQLSEQINKLKQAKIQLVRAQKQAENYAERVNALDKAIKTVNLEVASVVCSCGFSHSIISFLSSVPL